MRFCDKSEFLSYFMILKRKQKTANLVLKSYQIDNFLTNFNVYVIGGGVCTRLNILHKVPTLREFI